MMQDRLPNGASVSRLWPDNKTELLGLFQYQMDAEHFVKAKLDEDKSRDWAASYIVACTYSGKVTVYGPENPPKLPVAA